ncbi:anthranilate synthase component I family protein [Flaviaesturariibacter flavus]|uniref:Anthranilate synthase component I family protein n=2 Tax=Flaviaesturariibacter flavus TaxID=2502780 RepID=A0A4R1BC67_9BACT|nr:anthranilate synthase component I family protein [Flaviaesturariibacter flavus]
MLNWLRRFNIFCFLDSHGYPGRSFDWLAGAGARHRVGAADGPAALDALAASERWAFGHLAFELRHAAYGLAGGPQDPIGFPPLHFFIPEVVLYARGDTLHIEAADPDTVWKALQETPVPAAGPGASIQMEATLSRAAYLDRIGALLQHIRRGDCYEINFCQEFHAQAPGLDPLPVYRKLAALSPTPFGGYYRLDDRYLLCASPERFLRKQGSELIAQPIKGTARRNPGDKAADAALREGLYLSPKERAENVMVVDLMRNDLSHVCHDVVVPELFGLYTFPQVHQMISTVSGRLHPGTGFSAVLDATFPMGSMTGAPKQRVLELIRRYEPTARGLFSGSLGYFHEGDFDFNVVIRSLLYNADTGALSYQVGSGITAYCEAAAEWEECRLKALALERAMQDIE